MSISSFDLRFEFINIDYTLTDIAFLLVADWMNQDNRINFKRPIQFDEKLSQLSWSVEQPGKMLQFGEVLYKVDFLLFLIFG